jgi:uncharacterized protein (TIGR01777 family)
MRAVITGATGFVGKRLLEFIDQPVVLSRSPEKARATLGARVEVHAWDLMKEPAPAAALAGADAVFHLAGDPIAEGRWNAAKKRRIRETRAVGTANLVKGLAACGPRPPVLISASAIGYYGDRGDEVLDDDKSPGNDFLAEVCAEWEREASAAERIGMRWASPRIGIVLGENGGALKQMLTPFKLGIGGKLGSGKQWMSCVHRDDLIGMMLYAATHDAVRGGFNAVGPEPVTNLAFTKTLGRVLRRPTIFPVPAIALKVMFGELSAALLGSQRCVPKKIKECGYRHLYPTLESALRAVLKGETREPSFARAKAAV